MLEKPSGLRELMAAVAGPRAWSDTRERWLERAARRIGISFRQTKSLWYGEISDPNHRSARLLRDAAAQRAATLAERYETIARAMDTTDPDFYRADVLGLIDAARALRGLDRSRDDQDREVDDGPPILPRE